MTLIQSLILIPVISNDQTNTSENYANKEDTRRNNVKVLTKANEISSPVVSNYIKGDLIKLSDSNDGVWKGQFDYSGGVNPSTQVSILVSLYLKNQNKLLKTLSELQDPSSPLYHHFFSQNQFIDNYSPDESEYNSIAYFFVQKNITVELYRDRVSLKLNGTLQQMENLFHTKIKIFTVGSESFFAPSQSLFLEAPYASYIAGISGLNNRKPIVTKPNFERDPNDGHQIIDGADLQTAYQLDQLYNLTGHPLTETIAIIGFSGVYANKTEASPYSYHDTDSYFNNYFPSNEPKPNIYWYPLNSAPLPSEYSGGGFDKKGYFLENELDIESAGSVAPGSSIVFMYDTYKSSSFDQCIAEILNPQNYSTNASIALFNTVAITTSYGLPSDYRDPIWSYYEAEAAFRGITVLSASGDDGNQYGFTPEFPGNSAHDQYGTISVGGTIITLNGSESQDGTGTTGIISQIAWPGSQGGISSNFTEPIWQVNSPDANSVITTYAEVHNIMNGRGNPDISGPAYNIEVIEYNGLVYFNGTSAASPLMAGVVATMDQYLKEMDPSSIGEGFFAPTLYLLGQLQYENKFASDKLPFYDITSGGNGNFSALRGYDLVTGWGSINAKNFVEAQLNIIEPTIQITNPSNNEYLTYPFTFSAIVNSSDGFLSIYGLINNTYLNFPCTANNINLTSYTCSTTINPYSYSGGFYTLSVQATDLIGWTTTSSVNIQIPSNPSPPDVSITSPADQTIEISNFNIYFTASSGIGISQIEIFINGNLIKTISYTNPYPTSISQGQTIYVSNLNKNTWNFLQIVAINGADLSNSASIYIYYHPNGPPPPNLSQ